MNKLDKYKFKVSQNITKQDLLNYGFKHINDETYIYRTPCYQYKNKNSLIYLEFTVIYDMTRKINKPVMLINCKNKNDTFYSPFYQECFNKNIVLDGVNKKLKLIINDMLKKEILIKKQKRQIKRRNK